METYGKLHTGQLKELLRQRGARVTGKKHDLIERLEAYDRNDGFGHETVSIEQEDNFCVPKTVTMSNLVPKYHHRMPALDYGGLQEYMCQNEVVMPKSAYPMFKANFAQSMLFGSSKDMFYFSGIVKAEMKKNITYHVSVAIDMSAVVQNGGCECTAGAGMQAQCKHIGVLLFVLEHFVRTGELKLEKSCTEKEKEWNKPVKRKLVKSPMKCQKLTYKVSKYGDDEHQTPEVCTATASAVSVEETSRFRNLVTNFECTKKIRLGASGIFPNKGKSLDVVKDHDYLCEQDRIKMRLGLHQVTSEMADEIEKKTVAQSASRLWLKERGCRLTSSNFGPVMRLAADADGKKLADRIFNGGSLDHVPAVKYGRDREPYVRRFFERVLDYKVTKSGLVIDRENTMLACSPDGKIDENTLVEIKCPYSARNKSLEEAKLPYLKKGADGWELKETSNYFYQIQGQLGITGAKRCYLVIYCQDEPHPGHIEWIIVHKVPGLYNDIMAPKLRKFYNEFAIDILLSR